jgi:lipopolysaccharide assembly outer membrane protein LptD (OstA)
MNNELRSMKYKVQNAIILSILLFLLPLFTFAQRTAIKDTIKPGKTLVIIQANNYNVQDLDSLGKVFSLSGSVIVQQEKTFINADSIVLHQKENYLEAFGNVHINDADSVHTYAQYVKYLGKEKKAFNKLMNVVYIYIKQF